MAGRSQAMKVAPAQAGIAGAEGADLGALQDVLGFRLRRIQNHLSRAFAEQLADRGIRPGTFSALALIAANAGISQTDLARDLGSDKASVVSIIDELEEHGWAARKRSTSDRRRHSLHVTAAGRRTLSEISVVARETEAPVRAILSAEEFGVLSEMLDRIYNRCFAGDAL
jgi:DNA-binding MarR family transcriptional regulator